MHGISYASRNENDVDDCINATNIQSRCAASASFLGRRHVTKIWCGSPLKFSFYWKQVLFVRLIILALCYSQQSVAFAVASPEESKYAVLAFLSVAQLRQEAGMNHRLPLPMSFSGLGHFVTNEHLHRKFRPVSEAILSSEKIFRVFGERLSSY